MFNFLNDKDSLNVSQTFSKLNYNSAVYSDKSITVIHYYWSAPPTHSVGARLVMVASVCRLTCLSAVPPSTAGLQAAAPAQAMR